MQRIEPTDVAIGPNAEAARQTTDEVTPDAAATTDLDLVEDELLVEEISIDGMCGVY